MLSKFSFIQMLVFVLLGITTLVLFLLNTTHFHLLLLSMCCFALSYTIYKTDRK